VAVHGLAGAGPESLKDKELHLWVTYPEAKRKKKKKPGSRRKDLKLWAVVIIEELRQVDAFAYEVTLRRIFKHGERILRVWVCNDPRDQSEEAPVFSFLSPASLTPLEQYLVQRASIRVYEAIAETWSCLPQAGRV